MVARADRILVLEQEDAKASSGILDKRVFTGGNNLHAVMDPKTCFWTLRMEHGLVPGPLKERFTDFNSLKKHVEAYFVTKKIKIKEIIG